MITKTQSERNEENALIHHSLEVVVLSTLKVSGNTVQTTNPWVLNGIILLFREDKDFTIMCQSDDGNLFRPYIAFFR